MLYSIFVVIQTNTSASAEIVGNSFAADLTTGTIIGFVATLLGSFGVWWLNKRNKKNRLRKAIIAEIEEQKETINRINETLKTGNPANSDGDRDNFEVDASELPPADSLPTTVYNSNASAVGELPIDEVEEVVEYYSSLKKQKATIQAIRNNEDVLLADKRDLHNDIPRLKSKRTTVIDKLERGFWDRVCS